MEKGSYIFQMESTMKVNFFKIIFMVKVNLSKMINNKLKAFGKILYYFKICEKTV